LLAVALVAVEVVGLTAVVAAVVDCFLALPL
jgi:hypothetical protein